MQPRKPVDTPGKAGIEVDGLSKIDTESVGILSQQDGGFGLDMWRGISRVEAVNLVNQMPKNLGSAALRDVAAQLLLSRAKAPVALSEDAPSLLVARAKALLAMGDVEGAELLIVAAPSQDRPMGLNIVDAKLQILKYNNARACGLAGNNRDYAGDDFWQRLLIYCDALDGKSENVGLGLSLLREISGDDPALVLLADAVVSRKPIILESIARPTPIHLAMSRAAKVELPLDIAKSDELLVLYSAAMAPNLKTGARIEAAERAVPIGALNPAELRRLYQQVPYEDTDLANALTRAAEIGGVAARALLYQAAAKQNIPSARAETISTALDIAREDGRYKATVEAFRPLINRLPPSPEMVWFALTGVRAFLTLGDAAGTDRWMALLRASASIREESRLALSRVRPLARLLGAGDASIPLETIIADWQATLGDRPEKAALRTALNGMFLAVGDELPASAWQGIANGAASSQIMPAPEVWFKFRDSLRALKLSPDLLPVNNATVSANGVVAGKNAEMAQVPPGAARAAIHALQVMGDGGPGTQGIAAIYEVVAAFRALGFERTARQLALETLLAAGL
ncbi:MAG: hypothetical protein WD075_05835 [Rhodospirillales bacterium]